MMMNYNVSLQPRDTPCDIYGRHLHIQFEREHFTSLLTLYVRNQEFFLGYNIILYAQNLLVFYVNMIYVMLVLCALCTIANLACKLKIVEKSNQAW